MRSTAWTRVHVNEAARLCGGSPAAARRAAKVRQQRVRRCRPQSVWRPEGVPVAARPRAGKQSGIACPRGGEGRPRAGRESGRGRRSACLRPVEGAAVAPAARPAGDQPLPASVAPGWPAGVALPAEGSWKHRYGQACDACCAMGWTSRSPICSRRSRARFHPARRVRSARAVRARHSCFAACRACPRRALMSSVCARSVW